MLTLKRTARSGAIIAALAAVSACGSTGGLGGILGGVLGGGREDQINGTMEGIDTRSQIVYIRQTNGQSVSLRYDNRTQVVYQNQNYPVTSLENGDEVTARISNSNNNNSNYTDLIQVNRSVSNSQNVPGNSGNVQAFQGTVRQVDRTNGWFTVDANNAGRVTVTLPYNPTRTDLSRFQNLRGGEFVRFYATYVNNGRLELRNFY
ncbi:MAG TPA: hypothetical protein VM939_00635 [Gemmatimonadaceae bacterium]|nr:hypothetical protein [Gemmatimonadaceae bacterium]